MSRRERRLRKVTGAVLIAAAFFAVAISIAEHAPRPPTERQIDARVGALLAGIPQRGTTLGTAGAPLTVTYFGDLECPVCRDFTLAGGFPRLVARGVRKGEVKVVYRSLCTATCDGPGRAVFNAQQVAAYAAGAQNRFWYFAELFYYEQGPEGDGYVTEAYLDRLAAQVPGLQLSTWHADRAAATLRAQLHADGVAARRLGIPGTPTLIVTGPKGTRTLGSAVPSYSDIQQALERVS
ncbi:MAG: DsbA family protein [Solirubrobacteraceae bacterium]